MSIRDMDAQSKNNYDTIDALRNVLYPSELASLGDGYYDAIVTRCIDKSNIGWVKVSVTGITDDLSISDQPWAEPAPGQGNIMPTPGTHVSVTFRDGDVHLPMWRTTSMVGDGKYFPSEISNNYPDTHVIYTTKEGTFVTNNVKTGEFEISHHSGSRITMKKNGEIEIVSGGNNPLVKQYPGVTGAAFCPFLTAASGTPQFHPTGGCKGITMSDFPSE